MPAKVELRKVRERDGGVKGVKDRTKPGGLKVGLVAGLGEHPNSDDGTTIVEVGAFNEFGSIGVPERPFLRTTIAQYHNNYTQIIKQMLSDIIMGKKSVVQAVGILGIKSQADVVSTINNWDDPPNSPETIDRKGSSQPLVDTGIMKKSINWEAV